MERNGKKWKETLDKKLADWYLDIIDSEYDEEKDSFWCDLTMESRWNFPEELWEDIIPDDCEEVYFRCLTEEYGCGLVSMAIYRDGYWWGLQCFDLGY